jgi:hypothetical protein
VFLCAYRTGKAFLTVKGCFFLKLSTSAQTGVKTRDGTVFQDMPKVTKLQGLFV